MDVLALTPSTGGDDDDARPSVKRPRSPRSALTTAVGRKKTWPRHSSASSKRRSPTETSSVDASSHSGHHSLLLLHRPRCPNPQCSHHHHFRALLREVVSCRDRDGNSGDGGECQYVMLCPECRSMIYPCDACHEVRQHRPSLSSSSHCELCGFATVVDARVRTALGLPALMPLASSTVLAIQCAINAMAYKKHRQTVYRSALNDWNAATHTASDSDSVRHRVGRGFIDGTDNDESDNTDNDDLPSPSSSASFGRSEPSETRLLQARLELLAASHCEDSVRTETLLTSAERRYGTNDSDRALFCHIHLTVVIDLLKTQGQSQSRTLWSAELVASFIELAEGFFDGEAEYRAVMQNIQSQWTVLHRVRECYKQLYSQPSPSSPPSPSLSLPSTPASVSLGALGVMINIIGCRLARACQQLSAMTTSYISLIEQLTDILDPLYQFIATGDSGSDGGRASDSVLLLVQLCRSFQCSVCHRAQRAALWSECVNIDGKRQVICTVKPRVQPPSAAVNTSATGLAAQPDTKGRTIELSSDELSSARS